MPQLRLPHAMIVDVLPDETDNSRRIVVLNVNEEYLFELLDKVTPQNIIKYLDMRGIQHRASSEIKFFSKDIAGSCKKSRKFKRIEAEQARLRTIITELIRNGTAKAK